MEGMADLLYLESGIERHYGFGDLTLGLQYADEDYSEGKAQVWGLRGEVGLPWGLSLSTAYNKTLSTHDMSADNFFGGGPYFSSSQNLTIAEAGPDGQALMATVSLDGAAGITGSYLEVAVLHIEGDGGIKADEVDTVVGYEAGEDLTFDLIYSDIKDRKESSNSFKNLRFFANYQF
ncbi:MAG TPA: hypothetical protein ENL02_02605 [Epsilonproteobacteria bacterium]|nr:hypothetical protein [Campylobacterota bacterium]